MAFTRHIDPVESMKIGRRENSVEVVGVQFSIDDSPVRLKTPELIFNFLKRIERIEFPDGLYRPHDIILLKKEEVEDTIDAFIQAMKASTSPVNPQAILNRIPKMKTEIKEIRLKILYEKTIIFAGQFILIPSEKDIKEKAPWLVEDEIREDERILNRRLGEIEMAKSMIKMLNDEAKSTREIQTKKHEAEMARQEFLKRATFKIKPNWSGILSDL
jgi:hypothetical protein